VGGRRPYEFGNEGMMTGWISYFRVHSFIRDHENLNVSSLINFFSPGESRHESRKELNGRLDGNIEIGNIQLLPPSEGMNREKEGRDTVKVNYFLSSLKTHRTDSVLFFPSFHFHYIKSIKSYY